MAAGARVGGDRVAEALDEQAAVGQLGERVVVGELADALLRGHVGSDVLHEDGRGAASADRGVDGLRRGLELAMAGGRVERIAGAGTLGAGQGLLQRVAQQRGRPCGEDVLEAPADHLRARCGEQLVLAGDDLEVAAVLVDHEDQVGDGRGDRAQARLARRQRAFGRAVALEVAQQGAEQQRGGAHQQQVGQAELGEHPGEGLARHGGQQQQRDGMGEHAEEEELQRHRA